MSKWPLLPILFFGMLLGFFTGSVKAESTEDILCLAENIFIEARSESTAGRIEVHNYNIQTSINLDKNPIKIKTIN